MLDAYVASLVAQAAPGLLAVKGVGTDTAATLLAATGCSRRASCPPPRYGR